MGNPNKIADKIGVAAKVANRVAGVAVILMILLIVTEVVLRRFFNKSTTLCDEYTGYFQAAVVFMTLAQCLRDNRHINVDLILRRVPAQLRYGLEIANELIALVFASVLLWACWLLAWESYLFGATSYGPSNTPLFIPQMVVVIGLVVFFVQILLNFIMKLSHKP